MKDIKKIKLGKLNFYIIDDNYIIYLSQFDKHIAYNKKQKRPVKNNADMPSVKRTDAAPPAPTYRRQPRSQNGFKNEIIAFAQCQLRYDYVEGTNSSPVGYLEGIYVEPMYRKQGIAKKLLEECEKWSLKKGCTEFASDCELNNSISFNFHLSVGFEEANRIICFRKKL